MSDWRDLRDTRTTTSTLREAGGTHHWGVDGHRGSRVWIGLWQTTGTRTSLNRNINRIRPCG